MHKIAFDKQYYFLLPRLTARAGGPATLAGVVVFAARWRRRREGRRARSFHREKGGYTALLGPMTL
jgi:hypothetical protein